MTALGTLGHIRNINSGLPPSAAMKGQTMKTIAAIQFEIANATQELAVRESAAYHLNGIPARQNQTAISRLYDRLNHLHIERIERDERGN